MSQPAKATARPRILIVDDSPDDRFFYRKVLERATLGEVEIAEAISARAALELGREAPPDCVLLDFRLPDLDGLEFLAAFRDEGGEPLAPVVMLTGQGNEEVAAQAIRMGAQDYIVKSSLGPNSLTWAIVGARARFALRRKERRQREEFRDFAHSAAHDLKAPLRKAESFTRIIEELLNDESAAPLEGLQRSLDQMQGMIDGLLAFAQAGTGLTNEIRVELSAVVEAALSNLESSYDLAQVDLEVGELPAVRGELAALVQVFQNLLANAIKFNRSERPTIRIRATREGDACAIAVSDNGVGIDPTMVDQVFQPFSRLHGRWEFEGSGLGLATCRRIIEHHGGSISCTSELGRGSTFVVRLRMALEGEGMAGAALASDSVNP